MEGTQAPGLTTHCDEEKFLRSIVFKKPKLRIVAEEEFLDSEDSEESSFQVDPTRPIGDDDFFPYDLFIEHEWDKLSNLDKASLRAFTWTPHPDKYPSVIPRKQYKCLLKYVLLGGAPRCFRTFMFVPEINENGNVHIHGWYVIKDNIAYWKSFLPKCKRMGYVKVKKGNIDDKWCSYLQKDANDTAQTVGEDMPVPLCDSNYKSYIKDVARAPRPKLCPTKTQPIRNKKIPDMFNLDFD